MCKTNKKPKQHVSTTKVVDKNDYNDPTNCWTPNKTTDTYKNSNS